MNTNGNILVTAATWYIGAQTIEAIKNRHPDTTVVAGVYDKSKKLDKPELWDAADDTLPFDANQPETIDFSRFDVVCIIPSTNSSRLIQVSNMIDECKHSANKPFVVFCTVADPVGHEGEITTSTRHMEAMLQASGVKHVIINCGFFHQNFEWNSTEMMSEERICLPIGHGEFAPVDARDVARLIAIILKDPENHEGNRYHMVGQQLLGGEGAARIASQALGYSINYKDIPESTYFRNLKDQGCSDGMAKSLCELCAAIKTHKYEQTITGPLLVKLGNRVTKLRKYFDDFGNLYGRVQTTTEGAAELAVKQVAQPEGWGMPVRIDEGYAEAKEETMETTQEVADGWGTVEYGREEQEDWGAEEAEKPAQFGEGWGAETAETFFRVWGGRGAEEAEAPVQYEGGWGTEESETPVQYGEGWGAEEAEKPVQYGEGWGAEEAEKPVQYGGMKEAKRVQRPAQYGRKQVERWGAEKPVQYGEGWELTEAKRVQRPAQYGREERETSADVAEKPAKYGEGWELKESKRVQKPAQYGREERETWGAEEAKQYGEGSGVKEAKRIQRPAQYGRERRDEWQLKEADRDRRYAQYRRKELEVLKSKEPDREQREPKVKKTAQGREEEEVTGKAPPAVDEERIVAIERDLYYLRPKIENHVDVLRSAQRDYKELSSLLTDTINDLNGMLKDRRASLEAEKQLVKELEDRKDDIDRVLCQLDREIRDQERGTIKERPVKVYPTSTPPRTYLGSPRNEKLEEGTRRFERFENTERLADYESYGQRERAKYPEERESRFERPKRAAEYEPYGPRARTRSEARRYPEKRRERRSASTTQLGRELSRGRASTQLGRELNKYQGENFLSKISHMLYGWKDKGEPERGQGRVREFEGGERHRREAEMYGYEEPRREYGRREHEREDREERRRRDFERQDREREERRRREYERQDRELEQQRQRDFEQHELEREGRRQHGFKRQREYEERDDDREEQEYRPKEYEESRSELRSQRRETGNGSDSEEYVWIPKHVIQEAVRSY